MTEAKPVIVLMDDGDDHWWRIRASNGEILAHSELYASKWNRNRAARKLASITNWPLVIDRPR
jgi:uncharacterized protein YegP (UPF0339 family)